MIKELTEQLSLGTNLTIDQMSNGMDEILTGTQNDDDVAEFLKNLTQKGESDDELLAMLNKMEEFSLHISPNCKGKIIDVCGTGGDKLKTFNISTAASFVLLVREEMLLNMVTVQYLAYQAVQIFLNTLDLI